MNIILQPCADEDSQTHFANTIASPVDIERIESFLSPDQVRPLYQFGVDGAIMVWGLTPAIDGSSATSWGRISRGDLAAFYKDKEVFWVGRVCATARNDGLARNLWGVNSKGQTWELLYFLDIGWSTDFPLNQLTDDLGYESDRVYRARVRSSTTEAEALLSQEQSDIDMEASSAIDAIWKTEDPTSLQQRIDELDMKLKHAPVQVRMRVVRQYERHAGIARLVKQRENYTCQLCGYPGFPRKDCKESYCEVHHKFHVGKGGSSLSDNLVVLCATCHRKAHHGDLSGDTKAKAIGIVV